jgi:NAD+-dependent protein deacetylase sirtuin 2
MGLRQALPAVSPEEKQAVLGGDTSIDAVIRYIQDGRARSIVIMCGAGVSTSAGIPDFRTPGTGLYDNLKKYNLDKPEDMFNIEYFRENPQPFYDLAQNLLPANFTPTITHSFMKLLETKGLLKRIYTQNIDTLERRAGIDPNLIVEVHGSFGSCHCTKCGKAYTAEFFKTKITDCSDMVMDKTLSEAEAAAKGPIPWCLCEDIDCLGNVKPDIVFFGESLPSRYFDLRQEDMLSADLLLVIGSSLKVGPFNTTLDYFNMRAPRLLINRERVGQVEEFSQDCGFRFDLEDNYRDVEMLGSCDDCITTICESLGWAGELQSVRYSFDTASKHT